MSDFAVLALQAARKRELASLRQLNFEIGFLEDQLTIARKSAAEAGSNIECLERNLTVLGEPFSAEEELVG